MCIFTGSVRDVSGTAIFARRSDDSHQVLVYSMALSASSDVAMVLPLPVPPGSSESAVRFIDLSLYPKFFTDLDRAFPRKFTPSLSRSFSPPASSRLAVHEVGSFEASFVPTRDDFSRVDPRFRLSDDVWRALPGYDDWGFAVFKLGPMSRLTGVHPMAFEFPQRDPDRLFFPTVHVHDGGVRPLAAFDHSLYCQGVDAARLERCARSFESGFHWEESTIALGRVIAADRAKDIVRPDQQGFRVEIVGPYPNIDVVI